MYGLSIVRCGWREVRCEWPCRASYRDVKFSAGYAHGHPLSCLGMEIVNYVTAGCRATHIPVNEMN